MHYRMLSMFIALRALNVVSSVLPNSSRMRPLTLLAISFKCPYVSTITSKNWTCFVLIVTELSVVPTSLHLATNTILNTSSVWYVSVYSSLMKVTMNILGAFIVTTTFRKCMPLIAKGVTRLSSNSLLSFSEVGVTNSGILNVRWFTSFGMCV